MLRLIPQINPINWLILFILLWALVFFIFSKLYYKSKPLTAENINGRIRKKTISLIL